MTLGANKRWIFLLLVDLEIQSTAIIRCRRDMTSISSAARSYSDLQRPRVKRIEGRTRDVVTTQAIQIGMLSSFVPETAGGNTPAPFTEHSLICDSHGHSELGIEIDL